MTTSQTKPATTPKAAASKSSAATQKPVVAKSTPAKTTANVAKSTAVKTKTTEATDKKNDKDKSQKLKMERDSFTMPKAEYAQIYILKDKLIKLGQPAKKSELLRAGLMLLSAMDDEKLKATMAKVPAIKTGRPKK